MVRAGRRLSPPLILHSAFRRAVENVVARFGLTFLKQCAGNRCDRIITAIYLGRAAATAANLATVQTIAAILGVDRSNVVLGEVLPALPLAEVRSHLLRLRAASRSPLALAFLDERLRQIETELALAPSCSASDESITPLEVGTR